MNKNNRTLKIKNKSGKNKTKVHKSNKNYKKNTSSPMSKKNYTCYNDKSLSTIEKKINEGTEKLFTDFESVTSK